MIQLQEVAKVYPRGKRPPVPAVAGVSLAVDLGEFVVITGKSGCGKTTLLNLMAGLARPTSGTVTIDGIDIWSLDDKNMSALRSQKIGFVFQVSSLVPTLCVLDNVALPSLFTAGQKGREAYEKAAELLSMVGLSHRLEAFPSHLSGGEERRVALARALFHGPSILLADEPTANLDVASEAEIMALLQRLHSVGTTIVLVTHDPGLVGYGSRHLTMAEGRLVA